MAFNQVKKIFTDLGKAAAHSRFPNDFEYYAITLELTDSKGDTIDYLTFPVNPDNIDYNYPTVNNIKKNFGGVTSLDNESFNTSKYSISGTFGRAFKIIIDKSEEITHESSTSKGLFGKMENGAMQVKESVLNGRLKTGYGTIKILESIIKKSKGIDKYNRPVKLWLYNPTLNHNFLVKVTNFNLHQDVQGTNMIWKYTLEMSTLAPIDDVRLNSPNIDSTKFESISKNSNVLANSIYRTFNGSKRKTLNRIIR